MSAVVVAKVQSIGKREVIESIFQTTITQNRDLFT